MQSGLGVVKDAPSVGGIVHFPVHLEKRVVVVQLEGIMHIALNVPRSSELLPHSHTRHEPVVVV